eukprot:TRINITY_DN2369_c0_g1_i1.p1 TRINITY_DN2369_c0_g1~~TRINITY_DN2369_c0_g1_i1.p1  ORF type:complete len:296 (-),score=49.91 TRINITY_DN2369_c0_g1_i1:708-1595(-)
MEVTFADHLVSLGCSDLYVDEIANGISRAIYNQNVSSMSMAAGMISLAGSQTDELFGYYPNNEVFERIFSTSPSTLHLGSEVLQIELSYEITTEILDDNISKERLQEEIILHQSTASVYTITYKQEGIIYKEDFDAVILATPLEHSNIKLIGVPSPPLREYVKVYVSFVHGILNYNLFSVSEAENYTTFLTTQVFNNWTQLSILHWNTNGSVVVKFFSVVPLTVPDLYSTFSTIHNMKTHIIPAYPKLSPSTPVPHYILANNLFYLNAFESFISVMEGAAVSAKNAINILTKEWT